MKHTYPYTFLNPSDFDETNQSYNSHLPGFQVPVEVCVGEKEGREQEHVDKVGGDAVGVVQHHPDHPHN